MRHAIPAVLLLILALVAAPALVVAQPAAPAATGSAAVAASGPLSQPVPVPQPGDKAMRYYRSGNLLWVIETLWGFAVPALLLFTGFSARMRDAARKVGRNWFFTLVVYGLLFTLVTFILSLPLDWYTDFVRQHAYGLSDQTAAKWWSDAFTRLAIACIATALTLWLPYLLLRWSPRRWWLYTGLAAIPLIVVLLIVTPIWIEPRFNQFGPMKDKALESQILALADRAGIEGSRVYEVNKSVDTKTVNAYVTGVFGTKRIVLWDTTLRRLDKPEVLYVMGHEMGHYVLGHVFQLVALASLLVLFGLWVIHRTAGGLIARYRDRFGFVQLSDVASLPLIALLFGLVTFVLSPALLAFTRHTEHEADRFGLEITRDNHDCATAFVKLQEQNLSNPRPSLLYKLWRSDHPPLGERIDFCNEYRPWEKGEPLKYGDLIQPAKG
ncbi:MAG TPA: M48 family metallopeptidase [Thermoanaerobaculia bacterium]|jgi:Zn-dependent protease with chaperone function|nr:M48 family metallopeptidase [Thermoanaerobaculia bacterium]